MDLNAISQFFTHIPLGWVAIGVTAFVLSADSIRGSSSRATSLALAFLVAPTLSHALLKAAFISSIIASATSPWAEVAISVVLLVALFIIFLRIIGQPYGGGLTPIQAIFAGISATCIIAISWLQTPALLYVFDLGKEVGPLFGTPWHFVLLFGALITLAFTRD